MFVSHAEVALKNATEVCQMYLLGFKADFGHGRRAFLYLAELGLIAAYIVQKGLSQPLGMRWR